MPTVLGFNPGLTRAPQVRRVIGGSGFVVPSYLNSVLGEGEGPPVVDETEIGPDGTPLPNPTPLPAPAVAPAAAAPAAAGSPSATPAAGGEPGTPPPPPDDPFGPRRPGEGPSRTLPDGTILFFDPNTGRVVSSSTLVDKGEPATALTAGRGPSRVNVQFDDPEKDADNSWRDTPLTAEDRAQQRAMIKAQINDLIRRGRIDEAQMWMQMTGFIASVDPQTGEITITDTVTEPRRQFDATLGENRRQFDINQALQRAIQTGVMPDGTPTIEYMRMTGFTPSGDPILDTQRFKHQMMMDFAGSEREDARLNLERERFGLEGQRLGLDRERFGLEAALGYAGSERADVATNLARQAQAFGQGQDIRQNYRTDQDLGLRRQGQAFNQQQQERQQAIELARSPRDYLSYAFMTAGVPAPEGVELAQVLNRAGRNRVAGVDDYLARHGMGNVRPSGTDNPAVPGVEEFLGQQASYRRPAPTVNAAPTVAPAAVPAPAPRLAAAPSVAQLRQPDTFDQRPIFERY